MDIAKWVASEGGIVHRQRVLDAGAPAHQLRAAIARGDVNRIRRYWVATADAPAELLFAARCSARLGCISAARFRGWWMPPGLDEDVHLTVKPDARRPDATATVHWSPPLVPLPPQRLVGSVPDALEHVAGCLPFEPALIIWESAIQKERLHPQVVARVAWRSAAARRLASVATGSSDSGLETIFVVRLSPWGVRIRQQVHLAGHRVDVLVGDRLVIQLDGFAFHSSPADRQRDLAHDRELTARGYTVLRFTYRDVVSDWPAVERAIANALAQGLHRAA
jgi:very-short-patch-repair endonuclease